MRNSRTEPDLAVEVDERSIDAIFAEFDQCHLPGVAVGIAVGGQPVYRKGFGLASMELPIVLSPTIRMRIFSTTKHFTCLAYLLLCEEGKAAIDDPIGKHLPELNAVTREITMRQLMGHLSGLRDVKDLCLLFSGSGRQVSSADLLAFYDDIDDVNAAPGTSWSYNNGGYLMLTTAIERITGQTLENVFSDRIFRPVGMHDSLVRRRDSDFVSNSATLHMMNSAAGYDRSYLGIASAGEGGIVSTVDDMLRWLDHMDAPVIGAATTWAAMKASQRLANGTATGYGLGLMTGFHRGVETVHHAGGGMGGNSQMLKVPAAGVDIVIMSNRHDASSILLAERIIDACLPGLEPVRRAEPSRLVCGTFQSPTTGRVLQLRANGEQQIATLDGVDMIVEPDDDGVLWPTGTAGHVKVAVRVPGPAKDPSSIHISDFGNTDELHAVSPPPEADDLSIIGCYRSTPTRTNASICATGDGIMLRTTGRFGSAEFRLHRIGADIWRATLNGIMPWGGILSFDNDRTRFDFSSPRTHALPFRRMDDCR